MSGNVLAISLAFSDISIRYLPKLFSAIYTQSVKAADDIYRSLPEGTRNALSGLFSAYHFTESQKLEILKEEADLRQWKEESFTSIYKAPENRNDGRDGDRYIRAMRAYMNHLRSSETDYSDFTPNIHPRPKSRVMDTDKELVLSRCPCPVDGEKTRCCKLRTLDVIEQCAFSCSYCSVQAFYSENEIHAVSDIKNKLLALDLDDSVWHIGTGQASDSILLGDDHGTLTGLIAFAEKHPDVIIELKSKSARNVFDRKYPENIFFSWSLNAETIIRKEEHLTASLDGRIENAMRARDNGNLVGFHIHPMVYFRGWEDEYEAATRRISSEFKAEELFAISIGTLTFTKSVLKRLRMQGEESRILEMELTPAAGKFSYPLDVKRRMFSHVYSSFPQDIQDGVFFYLCMEDPSLWLPVLGREYGCDKDFEEDMKRNYLMKRDMLKARKHTL